MTNTIQSQCPLMSTRKEHKWTGNLPNQHWWPNQLNLKILHQNSPLSNPLREGFDYRGAFETLDLGELKRDLMDLIVDSQEWWPADYGNYGPLFIRMAWHSAGTYRIFDGRGGAFNGSQRFAPLNSWPDNTNLDKARALLWPVKKKYGSKISWADLIILAGNCALESMGFQTFGFGGGRLDIWEPEEDIYWGSETIWLSDEQRYRGNRELVHPLGAVQMGLIYVNPEGPNGIPDPLASAKDIRETFSRMAMDDEETVALIAGGHTFGKAHGAGNLDYLEAEPEGADLDKQGLGWNNSMGSGKGADTISSGLEGAWTPHPTQWDDSYFNVLFDYDWELTKSPAGAHQWTPKADSLASHAPSAHDPSKTESLMMTTADMALKMDPIYKPISLSFRNNPDKFSDSFARAWFKLTHRDMGPMSCYWGSEVPSEEFIWQDPIPVVNHELINQEDIAILKEKILASGLSISRLVLTAWASASTFRGSDRRGGGNGGRLRLAPQKDWDVNNPSALAHVLKILKGIQTVFNSGKKYVSLADLIILCGCAAIEKAAKNSGYVLEIPFLPGRSDSSQEQTDIKSFSFLEPKADGFRNYNKSNSSRLPEELLLDRAQLLTLTAPEMTVLIGGMRVLGANADDSKHGILTLRPETLSNDFFVHLMNRDIIWEPVLDSDIFEGRDRLTREIQWTSTRVDLVFGSNSQLRAISEVYASDDANEVFIQDFGLVWNKVMNADRFDLN
ncbi:catalase/peroxidase HPI [Candidatus Endowatersipora endosymbiont of Watersipora subatra]|uniref:catalase/peroxidase HPI n=1 Tax=Candidatus Endowatersipora endosymbiont of Watersipora subatra TaxID=3077946 RepID=UPI003C7D45AF